MLTLWDVQDRTAAELIKSFYINLKDNTGKAATLRTAMIGLRERHPHPYYWAPFFLTGSAE